MKIQHIVVFTAGACITLCAHAEVAVTKLWARATAPGQTVASVYLQITSDQTAKLVGVSSSAAKVTEIHEMKMDGDVMQMRAVATVDLPAGRHVDFNPGGYHIMLFNIVKPLKAGDSVPLILTIESVDKQRSTLKLKAAVRAMSDAIEEHHHDYK